MNKFDLAVVGGGILGIAHAYHALQAGLQVAVFEKDAHPVGATVRNFGQIVPSGMNAKWQLFGRRSLEIYRELQQKGDITVSAFGSVYFASDFEEMTLLEELARINKDNDYTSRLLTRQACLEQYPGLRTDYVVGGLFFPQEITLDPRMAIHRITRLLEEQYHLKYFSRTTVTDIVPHSSGYTLANNNRIDVQAEKVVICSGSDVEILFPEAFQNIGLLKVKLQMMQTIPLAGLSIRGSVLTGWTIRRYESFQECPSYPEINAKEDPDSYHRRMGIHILFKQTSDGSLIIGDSHEYYEVDKEEPVDFRMNEALNRAIVEAAGNIYRLEGMKISKSWIGMYSQCRDRDILEMEIAPNVHIVTAIGGKGMTGSLGFASHKIASLI